MKVITTTIPTPVSTESNVTDGVSIEEYQVTSSYGLLQNLTSMRKIGPSQPPEACQHIITTYVIPNVLHFLAYIMGIVHFRIQENEQLYAIMEKVIKRLKETYEVSVLDFFLHFPKCKNMGNFSSFMVEHHLNMIFKFSLIRFFCKLPLPIVGLLPSKRWSRN